MKRIAIVIAAGTLFAVAGCSKTTQDDAAATFNSASADAGAASDNAAAQLDTATDNLGAKTDAAMDAAGNSAMSATNDAAAWSGNAMQAAADKLYKAGGELRR